MEETNSIFTDVAIDYYNEKDNYWAIDAWETNDDDEEGVVVAKINIKSEIEWVVEDAKNDPLVNRKIDDFMKRHWFSAKDYV